MDDEGLDELDALTSIVKKLQHAQVESIKATEGAIGAIAERLERDRNLNTALQQDHLLTHSLLLSLIGALSKSGVVKAEDVAQLFQAGMPSLTPLLDDAHIKHADQIASELSRPGFPDPRKPPRWHGPTLIVDND